MEPKRNVQQMEPKRNVQQMDMNQLYEAEPVRRKGIELNDRARCIF